MRVNLSRAQADHLCRREYGNRLLSDIKCNDSPHDIHWWRTLPKPATSGGTRRPAAILAYLSLGQHAAVQLRQGAFPAVFDFNDGTKARRVDKGTIKALLSDNFLDHYREYQELFFFLTPTGNRWLDQHSLSNPVA
jgi:hypothetical protein